MIKFIYNFLCFELHCTKNKNGSLFHRVCLHHGSLKFQIFWVVDKSMEVATRKKGVKSRSSNQFYWHIFFQSRRSKTICKWYIYINNNYIFIYIINVHNIFLDTKLNIFSLNPMLKEWDTSFRLSCPWLNAYMIY